MTLSPAKQELLRQRLTRGQPAAAPLPRRPDGTDPPLSFAQERLWFMEQFAPGTSAYGSPLRLEYGPELDLPAMAAALADLVARHESLRMRFPSTVDGKPMVVVDPQGPPITGAPDHDRPDHARPSATRHAGNVDPAGPVPFEVIDVDDPVPVLQELSNRPFDLATGPLLRVSVLRHATPPSMGFSVLLDMHHIVTDGWSNDIVLSDLHELYQARRDGRAPRLPDLPVGYGDFAAWQREWLGGPQAARGLEFWLERLRDLPALELLTDKPRPPTQRFDGQSHRFVLEPALAAGLTALGRAHGATLFMTLLAAWQALLSRHTGQTDFAVGSPVAGRARPELDGVVGMFVNMLPLRADLTGDPSMESLLGRTRTSVLDALAHQDVPFEKVVNDLGLVRDVTRPPLFQTMLVLQNYSTDASDVDDLAWEPVELPATRYDLEWHSYATADGGLACRLVYNTALFTAGTVARVAQHLLTLLRDMVSRPQARLSELELLDDGDRALLDGWNSTRIPVDPHATLPGLVAQQVRLSPEAVAVVDEQRSLTYAQLDRAANGIAARLRSLGIGPECVVGVPARRSAWLVTALLGVLKSGAAYLPLDPDYPAERIDYMLADAGAALVLDEDFLGTAEAAPEVEIRPDHAAYLIYTSGSTGRPKGVVNEHRGIVNRLMWMQSAYALKPDDVVLQKTPAGFDVSVWEFFWPLMTGATLVMARPGGHRDPAYLREVIAAQRVTTVHFVPSMLAAFLSEDLGSTCTSLRRIICSGEELPVDLARRTLEAIPGAALHNLYGPTEAAVDVTSFPCTAQSLAERHRVPIGAPIANVGIHILDASGRQAPVGAPGEIFIAGVQVARGYHRRPSLTAQRFLAGPDGQRWYATGDRGRWLADGTVEFLGRLDDQIKLRGLRIELGEIEAALAAQPGVETAAVAVKEPVPGDPRLVGYVVGQADPAALRLGLAVSLPDYMVPSVFVTLEALPLSPSGKVDRKALPLPELGRGSGEMVAPSTPAERAIAEIWSKVLGVETVGVHDDFFALGGHSLLATQVVARMRAVTEGTGRQLGVMDLFKHPTVAGLAALLEGGADQTRHLFHELTRPVTGGVPERTYVCVPYGGGSALVYQAIADLMPPGHRLLSLAMPGHDVGIDEARVPIEELTERCVDELLSRVDGPIVLYGHCGIGGAVAVALALRLEAAGKDLRAVYAGGVFPMARPKGFLSRAHTWFEGRVANRNHASWLRGMGLDVNEFGASQADRIVENLRRDNDEAEEFFTGLLDGGQPARLTAPIISVVGERDPLTDFYQERYREWRALTDTSALVVLDEAGHYFLRWRASEMAGILTGTPEILEKSLSGPGMRVAGVSSARDTLSPPQVEQASMPRFLAVAAGQLISTTGSAMTAFAIPIWVLQRTGSLMFFGLLAALAFVPVIIATPLAGAVADRFDRRKVMIIACAAAASAEVVFALYLWIAGDVPLGTVYGLVVAIAFAGAFQRVTFLSAIPQLAPKRFLGHANGVSEIVIGAATMFAPLFAAGLYAAIDLKGILLLDMVSYAFAIGVLLVVRFPNLMGWWRRETFTEQILGGLRLTWNNKHFRAMLVFYALINLVFAVPLLMVTPLVLSFGTMVDLGWAAFAEAIGALLGGLIMAFWGGPQRRLMIFNILAIAVTGVFAGLSGVHPSLAIAAIGVFGSALALAVANAIYLTVVQFKIPNRYHGRVFALNQTLSWSTIPIAFALAPQLVARYLEPPMQPGGALAGTVGAVIGTGPGRGVGLAFIICGALMALGALAALGMRRLARLDTELPDALPDDLVGVQELAAKQGETR